MSGTEEQTSSPGWLGGSSQLADADFWRAFATEAAADLPTMLVAARRLRDVLSERDLMSSLRTLASVAEGCHPLARLAQADLEAVRVLVAAGEPVPDEIMVLFPVEPGAVRAITVPGGGWYLDGTQSRTVHPQAVDRALVVASTTDGDRMFTIRMDAPGVVRDPAPLRIIAPADPNGPVTFTAVPATPVGTAAWWAGQRPSFDGLLRDAACWFGSCVWLCRAVEATITARTDPTDLLRVGRVDVWMYSARLAMRDAAVAVEHDPTSPAAELAARRSVAVTATTVDTVVRLIALLSDARVSNEDALLPIRVSQLQIALRRFDAEANLRLLGATVADRGAVGPGAR